MEADQCHLRLPLAPSVSDKALGATVLDQLKIQMTKAQSISNPPHLAQGIKSSSNAKSKVQSLISIFTILILNPELIWALKC